MIDFKLGEEKICQKLPKKSHKHKSCASPEPFNSPRHLLKTPPSHSGTVPHIRSQFTLVRHGCFQPKGNHIGAIWRRYLYKSIPTQPPPQTPLIHLLIPSSPRCSRANMYVCSQSSHPCLSAAIAIPQLLPQHPTPKQQTLANFHGSVPHTAFPSNSADPGTMWLRHGVNYERPTATKCL